MVDAELEVLGYSRKYHEAVTKVLAKVQEGEEDEDEDEDIIIPASKPPSVEDAKDAGMVRPTPGRRSLEPAFGQPPAVAASEPSSEASAAADALVASALAVVLAAKADTGGAGICEHGTVRTRCKKRD